MEGIIMKIKVKPYGYTKNQELKDNRQNYYCLDEVKHIHDFVLAKSNNCLRTTATLMTTFLDNLDGMGFSHVVRYREHVFSSSNVYLRELVFTLKSLGGELG